MAAALHAAWQVEAAAIWGAGTSIPLTAEANIEIFGKHLDPHSEQGQAMTEYALILALVSVAALVALRFVGEDLGGLYSAIGDAINAIFA